MKKSNTELLILFLLSSSFFLLVIWGVKQLTVRLWYRSEVNTGANQFIFIFKSPGAGEIHPYEKSHSTRLNDLFKDIGNG
jgi:hypothetical protein